MTDTFLAAPPSVAGSDRLHRLMARGAAFLGSEVAILGGAMSWVSERNLVAAISGAGGFGVLACGAMTPALLQAEIAGTQALTTKDGGRPFGVNLITMHPQLDELIAVCAAARVGHVVLAGGFAAQGVVGGHQVVRCQGDLLCADAGAGQEADPFGRRRAGDRGDGGGRPYRAGVDGRAGAGDAARDRPNRSPSSSPAASAGVKRSRAIWRWARRECSSAPCSSARPSRSPTPISKRAFIRASARRRGGVGADRPAPARDPGTRVEERRGRPVPPPSSARSPDGWTKARWRWRKRSWRSSITGPARCAAR